MKDLVGAGTFGQVAKCFTEETNEFVAVKVIKNLPAYYTQARFEIGILHMVWNFLRYSYSVAVLSECRNEHSTKGDSWNLLLINQK